MERKYLYGHIDEDSAYIVEDYPWGFTTKTTARFWVETISKKRGGQRFVKQTLNPKTGIWCKPKKTVYSSIIVMYLDKNNYIAYENLIDFGLGSDERKEEIDTFFEIHKEHFTDYQKKEIEILRSYNEVLKNVKFTSKMSEFGAMSLATNEKGDI